MSRDPGAGAPRGGARAAPRGGGRARRGAHGARGGGPEAARSSTSSGSPPSSAWRSRARRWTRRGSRRRRPTCGARRSPSSSPRRAASSPKCSRDLPPRRRYRCGSSHSSETRADVERLGQVNLAAIDELKEQTQRKEYLDSQFADLNCRARHARGGDAPHRQGDAHALRGHLRAHQRRAAREIPAPVRRRPRLP